MVPLEVQFNPHNFQEDVVVNVSFFKYLVIVSFFKRSVIVQFFNAIIIVFPFFQSPSLLFHFLQLSCFCFIFFNHPILVSFLQSSKKFQAMVGIEPEPPEWQPEVITIRPCHSLNAFVMLPKVPYLPAFS